MNPQDNATAPSPQCFLACLSPGIIFPLVVGSTLLPDATPFSGLSPTYTIFTNASTLRTFLQANLALGPNGTTPLILGINPTPVTDPTTNSSGFPPAEFIAELVVAILNNAYQQLYGEFPSIILILNGR